MIPDSFYNEHGAEIDNALSKLWDYVVLSPLSPYFDQLLKPRTAAPILATCFARAEKKFATICRRRSLDFWLPFVRFYSHDKYETDNWQTYLTLGLLRYCSLRTVDVVLKGSVGDESNVYAAVTLSDYLDAQRLGYLAYLIAHVARVYRRIGKGSCLKPALQEPLREEAPASVEESMSAYDARRPRNQWFRDQGILTADANRGHGIQFLAMGTRRVGVDVPGRPDRLPNIRLPILFDATPIQRVLESYREAIEDIHRGSLEALLHALASIATLTCESLPVMDQDKCRMDRIHLLPIEGEDEDQLRKRVDFLFSLSRKGYLRFPLKKWCAHLARVCSPWAVTKADGKERAEEFFRAFLLEEKTHKKIDLSCFRPVPICFRSASGIVYFDVQAMPDFLGHLVESAKRWFSSQGGDRFTLAVKNYVESNCPEVEVVGWKQCIRTESGKKVECDLVLATQLALFVVECKAFAKSRGFLRGDPKAVQLRSLKLQEFFRQAEAQVASVAQAVFRRQDGLPLRTLIKPVVCTPSQEFIHPVDAFGFLMDKIPAVCTPEELVFVLNR